MATHTYAKNSSGVTINAGTWHEFYSPKFTVPDGETFTRVKVVKMMDLSAMTLQNISGQTSHPQWDTWFTNTALISWSDGGKGKVRVKNTGTVARSFNVQFVFETEDKPTYSITCKTTGSGSLSASKSKAYQGQTITLTPTPATGYYLSGFTKSPSSLAIANNKFTMPNQAVTVTANFTNQRYALTVVSEDTSKGTVTGSGTFAYGSTVTIKATPKAGYIFTGWTKTAGTIGNASAEQTTFTIPASAATVTAHFAPKPNTKSVVGYYHDGAFEDCNVAVYDNGAFVDCDVFIYDDGQWKKCSKGGSS